MTYLEFRYVLFGFKVLYEKSRIDELRNCFVLVYKDFIINVLDVFFYIFYLFYWIMIKYMYGCISFLFEWRVVMGILLIFLYIFSLLFD